MKLIHILGVFLISAVALASEEIKVCPGLTTSQNILDPIAGPFLKKTDIKITAATDPNKSNSVQNLTGLLEGKCEAAVNAQDFQTWVKQAQDKGIKVDPSKLTYRVIGRDYAYVIMNKDIPVKELTDIQVGALFSGKIKNWSKIGGSDVPVVLVLSKLRPATAEFLKKKFLKDEKIADEVAYVSYFEDVVKKIIATPGAIGTVPMRNAGGVAYPKTAEIGRPVTLVTMGKPSERMMKLIQFISGEGKDLVIR